MKLFKREAAGDKTYRLSAKEAAFVAAVEAGLLPEICVNGEHTHDFKLFCRFWRMFSRLLTKNHIPLINGQLSGGINSR